MSTLHDTENNLKRDGSKEHPGQEQDVLWSLRESQAKGPFQLVEPSILALQKWASVHDADTDNSVSF